MFFVCILSKKCGRLFVECMHNALQSMVFVLHESSLEVFPLEFYFIRRQSLNFESNSSFSHYHQSTNKTRWTECIELIGSQCTRQLHINECVTEEPSNSCLCYLMEWRQNKLNYTDSVVLFRLRTAAVDEVRSRIK